MSVTRRHVAIGVAVVALGGLVYFVRRTTAVPADTKPPPTDVSIDTPPGWTSKVDPKTKLLKAAEGPLDVPEPTALLTVDVTRVLQAVETDNLAKLLVKQLGARGLDVDETSTPETIGGAPAQRVVARMGSSEICTWLVKRAPFVLATMQCAVHGDRSCKTACKVPIDRLRWPSNE